MTRFSGSRRGLFACFLLSLLSACGGGGGGDGVVGTGLTDPAGGSSSDNSIRISGAAEKGPFVKGSEVLVGRLAADGVPSTDTTLSEIQDDLGTFVFTVKDSGPVLIAADGYHFNEITGSLSQGRLLLRAVYNASADADQKAYVNVLTHLAYKRTLVLMSQGVSVTEASKQAESDVLNALRSVLPVTDVTDFTQLSIYDLNTSRAAGNGYVLALSATVYQLAMKKQQEQNSSVDAELTALLNALSDDISDDGSIGDAAVLAALTAATRQLRPDLIRANLEARSVNADSQKRLVANMDLYIDTDGDGVVNAQDADDDNDGISDAQDASPYVYDEAPVLVPNAATAGVTSKTPFTLEWTTSEYAKQIEVQLARNDAFTDIVLDELAPSKQYTFTLDAGVYYVRARVQNELGGWGAWSVAAEIPVDIFAKSFVTRGGTKWPWGAQIIQTSDGGFLVTEAMTASVESPLTGNEGVVHKLDAMGSPQWRTIISTAEDDSLSSPFQASDGGYLIAVTQGDITAGVTATRVVKLDSAGAIQWWSPVVANVGPWHPTEFLEDGDGVVVGMTKIFSDVTVGNWHYPDRVPYLFKLDGNGAVVWSYEFDDSQNIYDALTGIWKTANGNYAVAGNKFVAKAIIDGLPVYQPFLLTLAADRSVVSTVDAQSAAGDLRAEGFHAQPSGDGGYLLSGSAAYLGPGDWEAWIYKISSTGERVFGGEMTGNCQCSMQSGASIYMPRSGSMFYGGSAQVWGTLDSATKTWGNPGKTGLLVIEAAPASGAHISRHFFGNPNGNVSLRSHVPLKDGGFALFGDLLVDGGRTGFVLIKTDQSGNAPLVVQQGSIADAGP